MRIYNALATAMLAAVVMTSCSEDQSTFRIESVPGRSVIEGTVIYNQGTKLVDGKFVYDYQPAADLKVVAIVNNSEYDNSLSGQSEFEATTDENGKYSFEIPAPTQDVRVTIRTASFRGERSVIELKNNKVVTTEEPVIYGGSGSTTARANGIAYCNINCVETSVDRIPTGLTEYASLQGRIGQNIEKYTAGEVLTDVEGNVTGHSDASVEYLYTGTPSCDLIISIGYEDAAFTYNATTDSKGYFRLSVPVAGFPANFSCLITAASYNGTFTQYVPEIKTIENYRGREIEYTDYTPRTLNGYYSQEYSDTHFCSFPVAAAVANIENKAMIFHLLNPSDDNFGYNASRWSRENPWMD